ncbi:transcriptional regulator [Leptolyngbya sp. Heron Island J]|uniref:MarR family winged helix-turn-helix transcriptional regulator n=1 Tax=Leptolyngbya sp. Heron Island J TaxID=1385935 RepID=UPI0003B98D76|nr:MarR family transcriptional regulator [Leptolyngbya sp. Heron Island J]ESA37972.1 transcriptional regulator [Leptolyngbya sp. Heron Island J]
MPDTISYLMAKVCRAHRGLAGALLADYGLHVGQEVLLMHLWEYDGRSQSELVDLMAVEPPTLTRMLNRLEKSGLVERQRDQIDARVWRIYLTEAGWALEEPIQRVWRELEARTIANLAIEERVLLRRLLMQVRRNLEESS